MNKRIFRLGLGTATLIFMAAVFSFAPTDAPASNPPPNEPAKVDFADGKIQVVYAGRAIFEGTVAGDPKSYQARIQSFRTGDKVEQVVLLFGGGRTPLKLTGTVREATNPSPVRPTAATAAEPGLSSFATSRE